MKRLEDKFEKSELNGAVYPVHPDTKKMIVIECADGLLIPLFSTKEKYDEWGFQGAECMTITDYKKLFECLMEARTRLDFRLILDPHIVEGNLRFQLILLDKSDMDVIKES